MKDTTTYYVWPDGSFVEKSEYSWLEYSYKGDDFFTFTVPADIEMDEVDLDELIETYARLKS